MRKDINNIIKGIIEEQKYFNLLIENHIRLDNIFSDRTINENANDVINLIKNNDWEFENPIRFKEAVSKSKHKEMLTMYSVNELSNMKLFKLKGYDIGYALKLKDGKYSEIVSVFNNEPNIKGIGDELLLSAIKNGGCYLDHYDGYLSNLYQSLGFIEYDRYKFDPNYDIDGSFVKKYGKSDVIFRKHINCK